MKEKQNRRWRLKLLSILSAFIVWLAVVNAADPVQTQTIEIPVEIINDEVLTAHDLTYEIVGKKTSTVSYEVKMTNASRIRPSDFRAYADMKDLWSVTGAIPIKVEVLSHSQYLESSPVSRTGTIKIETEPLQTKAFTLTRKLNGELAEGSVEGQVTLAPASITVEGPESLIGQISSVGVEIDVDGASSDLEGKTEPRFYDANGNKIELNNRVTYDVEEVSYYMTVLRVKNLALDFQVSGQPAPGYRFTGVECDLTSVPVMGLRSALASLQTVTISGDILNLSGARGNVVRKVNMDVFMPTGVSIAGMESHEIEVMLLVEPLEEREFVVELTDDCMTGRQDGYVYTSQDATVTIRLRALPEELDSLRITSDDIVLDVSRLGEGEHRIEPQLVLDAAYEIRDIPACTIVVSSEEHDVGEEAALSAASEAHETENGEETDSQNAVQAGAQPQESGTDGN